MHIWRHSRRVEPREVGMEKGSNLLFRAYSTQRKNSGEKEDLDLRRSDGEQRGGGEQRSEMGKVLQVDGPTCLLLNRKYMRKKQARTR